MKFQTFTKKEEIKFEKYCHEVDLNIGKNGKKNYASSYEHLHKKNPGILTIELQNSGVIIHSGHYKKAELEYNGILCNSYLEYLGFRDTKKFNKMLNEISKSLEDICYVHTGEIK